ncbi:MAG TPA: PAS domain S-box protein [Gallionella sp.]|nr:PAS domain S-box protein [Gallionella sp.]
MTLFAAGDRTSSIRNVRLFLPLLGYVAFALGIAALAFFSFQRIEMLIQQEKLHDLGAIADTKVVRISAWRDRHEQMGEAYARDSLLADEFGLWLAEGSPPGARERRLRRMMAELQRAGDYKDLALLDRRGVVRLSLAGDFVLSADDAMPVKRAMDSRKAAFSDIHAHGAQGICLDLIVPLTVAGKGAGTASGALVLQIDPQTYLYPIIRSWPTHSATAETTLVRRDGDDVLFLNELRHRQGTALKLRLPLDTPNLPAAMAVLGASSAADGVDYRGVPVVAEMRRVAGTPWFMVSKVDRDELFAPVNRLKQWSAYLGLGFIGIGGLLVLAWLRNYRAHYRILQAQHAAAVEREMLTRHYEYLTKYANDIILVFDETGRIVEANERAEQAYGYTRVELQEKRIPDLRDPAEDPAVFRGQLEQIKRLGQLRFETVNVRRDGTRFPIESSVRIIEVDGARYLQGIIRDISERKLAEEALRKSEAVLKKSQQMAHIGSWELDLKSNALYWSEENCRIFEFDPGSFGITYQTFLDRVHPDDRERVNLAYTGSVQNRKPYSIVHRLLFPDGRIKFIQEWCETYYDEAGQPLRSVGTAQDITEQQMFHQALRRSAQQIEDLYNLAPCGYHSLDANGIVVQMNDTELQWLGYTREEMIGEVNFVDLLAPGSWQVFRDNYSGFKQRGYAHDLEYELVRKDGTTFFVLLSATAVYDDDGEYLMSRSTLFDISARKQAEDELRLQGAILSQMEEGVILVRADSGTIVYANPKFEQMFGYATGEAIGLHVSNLNAPTMKSPEEEAQAIIAALQAGGMWIGEIHNRKKDGTPFWCHAVVSTFDHHDYGTVWVATHEDITARKQAETRLAESEVRFRTMADNAPIMIWMADAQEQASCDGCNYYNQTWYAFTGLPAERVHNCRWQRVIHADDRASVVEAYREAFMKAQPFSLEYRLRRHDGEFRWVRDSGVPRLAAEGEFLGFIGTTIDVTDHKLFDEMRAEMEHAGRLQIAGEMVSGLAHELSQPLAAASNYLSAGLRQMAQADWDGEKLRKTVLLAHAQTERAGKIINHLKDMVRKQRQERAMLDINALIRDTVHFMEYEIRQIPVSVIMDFYTLPPVRVGRVEIEQVLINLFKNAIEAMAEAPTRVLRITTRPLESGFVLVSVLDTGKGLAPDALDKIFDPFHSSKIGGLGLGLPICRSLIENHGGQIWAERNVDEGAEFNFTLPAGASDEQEHRT